MNTEIKRKGMWLIPLQKTVDFLYFQKNEILKFIWKIHKIGWNHDVI